MRRPLSAMHADSSPPCRAAPRAPAPLLPAEQRHARRPLLLSTAQHVRAGLLSGLRHDRPPSPADTEAAALDAAAAAVAPPSDVQLQELAVRLVTDTDRAAATDR